jgi:thiol:disulfide interchange protein/DsbC/DsbD-like thiol-disulfide interchange protein
MDMLIHATRSSGFPVYGPGGRAHIAVVFAVNRFCWRVAWMAVFLAAQLNCHGFGTPKTQIQLLLSTESARAGDTIWAGLKMDMPTQWHTYWRNGGDAGEPTKITWTLPKGITAGEIHWPVPNKDVETAGDTSLITYVYTGEVVLLTPITLAKDLAAGPLTLKGSVHWMECSDICVPADQEVSATLVIANEAKSSRDAALLDQWLKKVPPMVGADAAAAYWEGGLPRTNGRPMLIEWRTNVSAADFYPYASTNYDVAGTTETVSGQAPVIRLRKVVRTNEVGWPEHIAGILVGNAGPAPIGVEVDLDVKAAATGPGAAAIPASPTAAPGSLALVLAFAFFGGLILNVMPCVLPIIALKILSFVKQSAEQPRRVRNMGLVYGVGVLVSFLVLAGLAIGAQRAGGVANWGDAFRIPQVQVGLTVLVTLIALNLFGVFEITLSAAATGAASELASRQGYSGAFFNGVLATMLATPCTAPFLGAALAFAFTQPPLVIVLVFLAVAAGFAFPFVMLCWEPRWLKLLPKPGAWMGKFKVALGFPMLATAVWLAWLSAGGGDEVLWLGLVLVVLSLAAWVWGEFVQRGTRHRGLAVAICLALLAVDGGLLFQSKPDKEAIQWQVWSPQAVEAAQQAGHPALVDFTAKSCLTCQVNKKSSLEIGRTRAKLKETGAVAFEGDFTREDPAIARELERFHRDGVPLVLVYSKDAGREPEVLPVILTPSIVLNALERAAR